MQITIQMRELKRKAVEIVIRLFLEKQFDLGLHFLLSPFCPKTYFFTAMLLMCFQMTRPVNGLSFRCLHFDCNLKLI